MNNQNNTNLDALLKLVNSSQNKQKLAESLKAQLTDEQKGKLQNIINDRDALNTIMQSPQAKELLKHLNKK